jgi:hypothetical protein
MYPEERLVSTDLDNINKIAVFISNDFITIQNCIGFNKDFVRINHQCIKTL